MFNKSLFIKLFTGLKKKIRKKRLNPNLTLLVMHDVKKDVKRLSIPWWLLSGAIVGVLIFFSISIFTIINYSSLKNEVVELSSLRKINEKQAIELASLQKQAIDMKDKIESVDKLDKEVRQMVGLESEEINNDLHKDIELRRDKLVLSSRGGSNSLLDMKDDFDKIDEIFDLQSLKLVDLKKNIEIKNDEMNSYPNLWPVIGRITDKFGYRKSPFNKITREFHSGLDIAINAGTNISAAGSGEVVFSGYKDVWGYIIVINHGNGYKTYYAHNSKLIAEVGDVVKKGDIISKSGSTGRSTGPHLHFGIEKNGTFVDPLEILVKKED